MPHDIVIDRMRLSDREAVLDFLAEGYPDNPRQSDADFWNWHFLEHPAVTGNEPPVWLARAGDRIAGQLACIPINVHVKNETFPSAWILDLMIHPDFRRQGIMKKIVREFHKNYPVLLGVNTNEQHAPAGLKGLGWSVVGKIPRYHKLLYPGFDIKQLSPDNPLVKIVNLACAPLRLRKTTRSENICTMSKFDASFDHLWEEAQPQWQCSVERTADTLSWQYLKQPGKKFDVIGCYTGEKLMGYAVMFFRKPVGGVIAKAAITDICYSPDEPSTTIDALLTECVRMAAERRCGGVVIDVMDDLIQSRLRHAGFWKVKNPLQLMAWSESVDPALFEAGSWFLTRGDSDISIFEHANAY